MKKCYLCGTKDFILVNRRTRDNSKIKVIRCIRCGLTMLDTFEHLNNFSYRDSKNNYERNILTKKDYQSVLNDLASDDRRRVDTNKKLLEGKIVLDYGCGAGGFITGIKKYAKKTYGVEVDQIKKYYANQIDVKDSLEEFNMKFDAITIFHVLEHLPDPISFLRSLKKYLNKGGMIIIEVPNDDDALMAYYKLKPFINFTYWSLHLFSFNASTIKKIIKRAGYNKIRIDFIQRYGLANHLGWIRTGKPGQQNKFMEIEKDRKLNAEYATFLKKIAKTDTLIAVVHI